MHHTGNCFIRTFEIERDLQEVETFIQNTMTERYQSTTLIDIQRLWSQGFLLCFTNTSTDPRLVGLIAGIFSRPDTLRVLLLTVDPGFRRLGLGRQLLETLILRAKDQGAMKVELEVKVNTPAVVFYQAQGFKTNRVLPLFYQDCEDALLMSRRIESRTKA